MCPFLLAFCVCSFFTWDRCSDSRLFSGLFAGSKCGLFIYQYCHRKCTHACWTLRMFVCMRTWPYVQKGCVSSNVRLCFHNSSRYKKFMLLTAKEIKTDRTNRKTSWARVYVCVWMLLKLWWITLEQTLQTLVHLHVCWVLCVAVCVCVCVRVCSWW